MGTVYLINIERTNLYKIGITRKKAEERMAALQTGNPKKLILTNFYKSEYYSKIETILHRQLKHKKYQPEDFNDLMGEWFELDDDDVNKFHNLCKVIETNIVFINNNSTLGDLKL